LSGERQKHLFISLNQSKHLSLSPPIYPKISSYITQTWRFRESLAYYSSREGFDQMDSLVALMDSI
jgi:hypothetical protein